MPHNGWDHALKVTGGGAGLVVHGGAILLRKATDQAGLTADWHYAESADVRCGCCAPVRWAPRLPQLREEVFHPLACAKADRAYDDFRPRSF
jgi:hypothetical protein